MWWLKGYTVSILFVIASENIVLLSMSCSDFSCVYIFMYISSAGDVLKMTFMMSD